jgi:hypothetical protein
VRLPLRSARIVAQILRLRLSGVRLTRVVEPSASARSDRLISASNLLVDAATARVVRALKSEGVPSVLLRGPALARWLYDEEDRRPYADVDLLVPDDRLPDAQNVLAGLDFLESPLEARFAHARPAHAQTWIRSVDGVSVDLHRTLIGIGASPALFWRTISAEAGPMTVGREDVSVPSPAARALFVALHASQHGPGFGQGLEDLSRALERVPPATWGQASVLAEELEALPAFGAGIRLIPAGESLATALGLSSGQRIDRELAGSEVFHVAQCIKWMLEQPGLSRKAAFLARKLVPPPATMRLRSSLARHGRLALAVAYIWRALRLSWHALRLVAGSVRLMRAAQTENVRQAPTGAERHDRDKRP